MHKFIALIFLILLTGCSSGSYFRIANDIVGGTDYNFTNGWELGMNLEREQSKDLLVDAGDTLMFGRIFDEDPTEVSHLNLGVRQMMYTPSDLRNPNIIEEDNPYAGTATFFFGGIATSDKRRIHTEVELGVSGAPSGAETFQKFVHNDLDKGADPQGWHHQLEAEPIFNINHSRAWQIHRENLFDKSYLEYVHNSEAKARVGTIHLDFEISQEFKLGQNVPQFNRSNVENAWGIYLFTEPFVRAVGHNFYYDGTVFRDSPHTVESEPLVGGLDSGIGVEYGQYSVKFHYNIRTKDYKEQDSSIHKYGLLSFGVEW